MAATTTKVFACVGTVGQGLLPANFSHEGKAVLWSGVVRVRRVGGVEDEGRQFFFECYCKSWAGAYLDDPKSARWYDESGNRVEPVESAVVAAATEGDYHDRIIPAIQRLERGVGAEADAAILEPTKVGLANCWRYREVR